MTKEEVKNYLIKIGASSVLLQMPAVMERIYALVGVEDGSRCDGFVGNENSSKSGNFKIKLHVSDNGDITFDDGRGSRRFELRPNNTARYINHDPMGYSIDEKGEWEIDQFGMDERFEGIEKFVIRRRPNGNIKIGNQLEVIDTGSPILNALEISLVDDEERTWQENKEFLTKEYPITEAWFSKKEKEKQKAQKEVQLSFTEMESDNSEIDDDLEYRDDISEKSEEDYLDEILDVQELPSEEPDERDAYIKQLEDEIQLLKRENGRLRATVEHVKEVYREAESDNVVLRNNNEKLSSENEVLIGENTSLRERNSNLHRMLKQALALCERVKHSFVGKLFFGREVKQLEALPEGKKTAREEQEK